MATAYSSLWDEEDPNKPKTGGPTAGSPGAAQPPPTATPAPTFAQLQQAGMPRPPEPTYSGYGGVTGAKTALDTGVGGTPYGGPPPQNMPPTGGGVPLPPGPDVGAGGGIPPNIGGGWQPPVYQPPPHNAVDPGTGNPANRPGPAGGGPLDQSSIEAYLYQLLSDPTSTPSYQNIMKHIGSATDVDASKRGLFNSTVPVGINASAGTDLASKLQAQAYDQLRGYNQDYSTLLMQLLGQT